MKVPRTAVVGVVMACMEVGAKKAVKYVAPDLIVRATSRCWYGKKAPRKNARTHEIVLTIGKPNYAERRYIKLLQLVGEPFPVSKINMRF